MTIYNPNTYNPARGGHAPGHLHDAFLEAIEADTSPDSIVVVGYDETEMTLSQLCGLLWNCTDIVPSGDCDPLDIPCGSTYARAARKLKQVG